MQNKRHEQQYNGNRHQSSSFKGNNSSGYASRGENFDGHFSRRDNGRFNTDYYTTDISERASDDRLLKYGRQDYLSDQSRPYSEGGASYSQVQDQGSGFSQRDTLCSYPHQQSYGQGQYSALNYTELGLSRKEGYGQYPQQNWKNTNEAQWQTSKDSSTSLSHFGKGPKGFKRSDERIKEEVCENLFHDHHVDASEIDVTVQNGEITLSGTVTERRMKRLAEDCAESVPGVTDIKNQIKVQSPSSDHATYADKNMDLSDKTKTRTGLKS